MSAFECNITPTRIKTAKKINENREPSTVVLGPFSPKCIIIFEDVPVSKTARRFLIIENPIQQDLEVQVTKQPKNEYNLSLEWTRNTISASSNISMELVWVPIKKESCRETLQLTDQFGNKKDIAIVLKSVELKKQVKRAPNPVIPKKLKLKSPSPPKNFVKRSILTKRVWSTVQVESYSVENTARSALSEKTMNATNIFSNMNLDEIDNMFEPTNSSDKENKENAGAVPVPATPTNASTLFDNIKFTPATETKTRSTSKLEYLANLPTPSASGFNRGSLASTRRNLAEIVISPELHDYKRTSLSQAVTPFVKDSYSSSDPPTETPQFIRRNLDSIPEQLCAETPHPGSDKFVPNIFSTASRVKPQPAKSFDENVRKELDMSSGADVASSTYVKTDVDEIEYVIVEEPVEARIMSQTHRVEILTAINEEDSSKESHKDTTNFQKTFNVKSLSEENLATAANEDETSSTKRILSESLKEFVPEAKNKENLKQNQGSLPNLNQVMQSVENQFFLQVPSNNVNLSMESIVSTSEFHETEFNAQSSRFNIHETGLPTNTNPKPTADHDNFEDNLNSIQIEKSKFSSPKSRQKKLSDSPILASSPNLRRVLRQDVRFKSPLEKNQQMLTFSPPKPRKMHSEVMEKFEKDSSTYQKGTEIRTNTWKQSSQAVTFQVPKVPSLPPSRPALQHSTSLTSLASNVSSSSAISVASLPLTPRKYRDDHVVMYNPEYHLIGDPFAATTTCDPFLSSSMYLDEKSVDRIERQFKKWLNALVTIPAELDSDENTKIDVAKLFQEAQGKELKLAPTKEVVSSKYYKTRFDILRNQAINFYKSQEITIPMQKVARQIEDQGISIRTDKNIQLDLVLQRNILELLLCYNPLWLRIGLEVVFGIQLDLHSNQDILGLSRFIINRMFKDPYLEQKYGKNFKKTDELSKQMKKHQLKKFLFVIFFLDRAKEVRLIKHNPCLFVKKAPYKESNDILKRFASLVLANFGDIVKHLKRFGYILTQKQVYIDEFDYAFSNLAVDLRDGVRLTKVMEVILMRDDLTKKLRSPAISRLQKIYNNDVALKALVEAEYQILGDITSRDIADGHREKTLSLLWQIIYKFRAPRFNSAASIIQKWWRLQWLKVVIERRIQLKYEIKVNYAATLIQKTIRGFLSRKQTEAFISQRKSAVVVLQKYYRGFRARQHLKLKLKSVSIIQKWYRNIRITRKVRNEFVEQKKAVLKIQMFYKNIKLARKIEESAQIIRKFQIEAKTRHEKAVVLQKTFKSYIIRKKLRNVVAEVIKYNKTQQIEFKSASKIQASWKMLKCRKEFLEIRKTVIMVQQTWKRKILVRKQRENFLMLKSSTIKIQVWFRGWMLMKSERKEFLRSRNLIVNVQQKYRAKIQGRLDRQRFVQLKQASINIQRRFRAQKQMKIESQRFTTLKQSTILIQKKLRAFNQMQLNRKEFLELKEKVIFVQQTFRAKKIRKDYLKLIKTVTFVQQTFRGKLLMRDQRIQYVQTISAVNLIQTHFKARLIMKKQRNEFLRLKNATILIQKKFRATKEMQKQRQEYLNLRKYTIIIQQKFRATKLMRLEYLTFCTLQYYTIFIQQKYRGLVLMRKESMQYQQLKKSVITVQRRFRGKLLMRLDINNFLRLKVAVLCVQQRRRAMIKMRDERQQFLNIRKAAVVIQRRFRAQQMMKHNREEFVQLKKAVSICESRYKAKKDMQLQHEKYQNIKKAAITIQIHYKALLLARKERTEFILKKKAVIKIQQYFRGYALMLKEQQKLKVTKQTVVFVQKRYREKLATRKQRNEFLALKEATLKIQKRWRALLIYRIERSEFLQLKQATLIVQKYYRAHSEMLKQQKKFLAIKQSVILIQKRYRKKMESRKQRNNYLALKESVVKIQKKWRATLLSRKERSEFLQLKEITIKIQTSYRYKLATRKQREEFLGVREACLVIQRRFRAQKLMVAEKSNYLKIKKAVLLLENQYISWKRMKVERQQFLNLKQNAIFVQRTFKRKLESRIARKNYLKLKEVTVQLQSRIRGYLARKTYKEMITPEAIELRKRNKAARILQAFWRGYYARKKYQTRTLKEIAKRLMRVNQNIDPTQTLQTKIHMSIKFLKGTYNVNEAFKVLTRMEYISRITPHLLIPHAYFVAGFCYGIMGQAIRSEIDKPIIELCSCIILNLGRYKYTRPDAFQETGLSTVSQMLLRWCDKDCGIFNTLCTFIFVFSHCDHHKKKIHQFMTNREATVVLRNIKSLVARKEKMRQNSKRPLGFNSISLQAYKKEKQFLPQQQVVYGLQNLKEVPALEPDYGVVKTKPYIFYSSVFAFETILDKLDIKL